MATALNGSLGWTAQHPLQLGGPPLASTWARPNLPNRAVALMAHAYLNDGVTPAQTATFRVLNRPSWQVMTANGGPPQITLEVETTGQGSTLWGGFVWGGALWGGAGLQLTQGNIIKLTEIGSSYKGYVYCGIIEGFPDTRSATGTKHGILLTPYAVELTRVTTQLYYTAPVDVAQAVRDAVSLTQHCHCDQVSVPAFTNVPIAQSGAVDFRGQKVNQVLDTARSVLGPTWYWHCDELGRVWLQPQGSGAVYTLMGGQHYEERTSTGGEIVDRINRVPAVGGVPNGGSANIQIVVNGASQSSIGIRTLEPPLQIPGITDQQTLALIANGVLGTLDVTWTRVSLKTLPATYPQRIHMSQPGGAMIRYWEPGVNPMQETGAAAGYVGPFICQNLTSDGLTQAVEAGNIAVTSQSDVDNLVRSLVSRVALNALQITAAALNLPQTLTGSFQSAGGTLVNGLPAGVWVLDGNKLALYDPSGVRRVAMGNLPANGVSPAGFKFETDDQFGNPLFDSFGLIAVMSQLAQVQGVPAGVQAITSVSDVLLDDGDGDQATATFTLTRQARVKVEASVTAYVATSSIAGGGNAQVTVQVDGVDQETVGLMNQATFQVPAPGPATGVAYTAPLLWSEPLSGASHTIKLVGSTQDVNTTLNILGFSFFVYLLGS